MQGAGAALYHAVMPEHSGNGAKEALYIQPKADMLHIPAVQLCLFGNFQLVPAMDLRPAGQPRAHIVCAVFIPLGQQIILVPQRRARADDSHIPHKDIPQLGQLVQTGLAQETAHPGDILPRVVEQMGVTAYSLTRNAFSHGSEMLMQNAYSQKRSGDVLFCLQPAWVPDLKDRMAKLIWPPHILMVISGWQRWNRPCDWEKFPSHLSSTAKENAV